MGSSSPFVAVRTVSPEKQRPARYSQVLVDPDRCLMQRLAMAFLEEGSEMLHSRDIEIQAGNVSIPGLVPALPCVPSAAAHLLGQEPCSDVG